MQRVSVPALDAILGKELAVLNNGFIRVVDYMGDDSSIVQAARISYGNGLTTPERDRGLLFYLLRHRHTSPFEMCEIKLHIKMPIYIARQWIRHRTANVNEFSARYSFVPDDAYIPEPDTLGTQSANNHQATIFGTLDPKNASEIRDRIQQNTQQSYDTYLWCINKDEENQDIHQDHPGISREAARMNLTLNHYTQWYWKIDLHNLLHFVHLRAAIGAQREIRLYAECILDNILKAWVPWTYEAFLDYRQHAHTFSGKGMAVIKALLAGKTNLSPQEFDLSKSEAREIADALAMPNIFQET